MADSGVPPEILEAILQFLPGVSLAQAQRVCKQWYEAVCSLGKNGDIWRWKCLEEIPAEVLMQLTGVQGYRRLRTRKATRTRTPDDQSSEATTGAGFVESTRVVPVDEGFWKGIYREWHCSRFIGKWLQLETETQSLDVEGPPNVSVNCVKISGLYVYTGDSLGQVLQWDQAGHFERKVCQHNRQVTDLVLGKSVDFFRGHSEDSAYSHDTLISVSADRDIHVVYPLNHLAIVDSITKTPHVHTLNAISIWEDTCVVASDDRRLSVWKLSRTVDGRVDIARVRMLVGHTARVKTVSIWKNTIISGSEDCTVRMWNANVSSCRAIINVHYWVRNVVLRGTIGLCSADASHSLVQVLVIDERNKTHEEKRSRWAVNNNNKKEEKGKFLHHLMSTTAHMVLRGDILALGDSAGHVKIFRFTSLEEEEEDADGDGDGGIYVDIFGVDEEEGEKEVEEDMWINLNRNETAIATLETLCVLNTGADYITAIDIGDDGEGPVIAVSTNEPSVKIYHWCHPDY